MSMIAAMACAGILSAKAPAKDWQTERFPIGNGQLGAMPDGGIAEEHVQFNADSLWTGDDNPSGAVSDKDSEPTDTTPGFGNYQNFGEFIVRYQGMEPATDYRRWLDLSNAVHGVSYRAGGAEYKRECFVSVPDGVLVMRVTGSKPMSGEIATAGAHGERTTGEGFAGKLPNGLAYQAALRVRATGGTAAMEDGVWKFRNCRELLIALAADTKPGAAERPARALAKGYEALLRAHVAAYRPYFGRVSLEVGEPDPAVEKLTTVERILRCRGGARDVGLEALMFQFGRYLLICSSWPGTLPANLQGIWNDSNAPAWHSDYHTNINLQMNYWGAEVANLSEMHTPLFDLMTSTLPAVEAETRRAFPKSQGYAYRTSLNPFGGMGWRWNLPGAAWLAHHAYIHYAYTLDRDFLAKTGYPLLKGAALFCLGILKERPDGTVVVANGWSPEHGPREDGVTHDQQIVSQLFADILAAQDVLKSDPAFADRIRKIKAKLLGNKIGRWGQLQEWETDRDVKGDTHRHTSHLFAVYPGDEITPLQTPALAQAAAVALAGRATTADSRRSWTWPWRMAIWARLRNGAKAGEMLDSLLRHNTSVNLLTIHPPFQMDGNFGVVGAIGEALVQSHEGRIELLPVVMPGWESGRVSGLRCRGAATVGFEWRAGKVLSARIASDRGGTYTVRLNGTERTVTLKPGETRELAAAAPSPAGL